MAQKNHNLSRNASADFYASERASRTKRRRVRTILIAIISVVAILGLSVGAVFAYFNNRISVNDDQLFASLTRKASNEPFYMLLLGADKGEERYATEGEDDSNYRADTIILARIDPNDVKVTLVSIHRDLKVTLSDGSEGKINAEYSLGGPSGMVNAVKTLAGVDISHYAEIDFDSFMQLVDVVGGVEVTLPTPVRDPEFTKLDLDAGTHVLNSHDALMLCRARHAYDEYGDGDLYRAANQRAVISSILHKVLEGDHQVEAIRAMSQSLKTDLTVDEILTIAGQMRGIDTETNIYAGMTPSEGELIGDTYYEILDEPAWDLMMDRVDMGMPPFENRSDDETLGIAGQAGAGTGEAEAGTEGAEGTEGEAEGEKPDMGEVDKSGSVYIASMNNGEATRIAGELSEMGFAASGDESDTYTFGENLVVYADPAHEEEAKAIASYLGEAYEARLNDDFYMPADIYVRVAAQ